MTLAPLDDAGRQRWGLAENASGVLVASVDAKADAAEKGLKPGDVITRVNQQEVKTPADVEKAVQKAKSAQRKTVLLLVDRHGTQQFVAVELTRA